VARLRTAVARALAGGDDPSENPDALEDLQLIERADPPVDADKLAAFGDAIRDPSSIPGVSRQVVLARGQRFLLSLSMALEDSKEEEDAEPVRLRAERTALRRDRPGRVDEARTPFDPTLLELKGVGPKTASRLASRGLSTPLDVLFWLPRRYDDRRTVTPIADLVVGQRAVTSGTVRRTRVYGRPWRRIMEVEIEDGDDRISAMWFSNRRPRQERFPKGETVTIAGLVSRRKGGLQIAHPVVVTGDEDDGDRVGRVVPIYGEVPGVAGRVVEKAVRSAAERADEISADPMPEELLERRSLTSLARALTLVHMPPADVSADDLDAWVDGSSPAHERLAYDEFFYIQLGLALRRRQLDRNPGLAVESPSDLAQEAGRLLGFEPTRAQHRVIDEIAADMRDEAPMRRLLQGDVGSGKTMVALAAILAAVRAGCQAALMAPTEILAEQHMRTLAPALEKLRIRPVLHIGQARSSTRKKNLRALELGTADLAIGTHALIQQSVEFARLGLAVVDEQHRFGVAQRLGLVGKGPEGRSPHLLVMTATPIPRTLALTVHGDLDVSELDELPPGRKEVTTRCWSRLDREEPLAAVDAALERGEQAYVVCPVIEESQKLDVRAAEEVHAEMVERFGEARVGLLHGRLPPEERDRVMSAFAGDELAVLVTTTVVEVGVDVPGATVMLVEGADRFGLAQLHQLRGRVGRSEKRSECHLLADPKSPESLARLKVLEGTNDGFAVAEADLAIRGPGELYGRRQAGLPGFRFGNLIRDAELLIAAREDVARLLGRDPQMTGPDLALLRAELARRIMSGEGPVGEEAG
jgi:ATP-dependent DNA helicase RecG